MAGLRQLGQNMLLTKDDGVVITKVIRDKDERERIKKAFTERGIEAIIDKFEISKKGESFAPVKQPIKEKPEPKVEKPSGSYKGNER
jgi:ribosomal protein L19E